MLYVPRPRYQVPEEHLTEKARLARLRNLGVDKDHCVSPKNHRDRHGNLIDGVTGENLGKVVTGLQDKF